MGKTKMATKKKVEITKFAKSLLRGEVKRFVTIVNKYLPDGKNKKDILKKFEEVAELMEKALA